MSGISLAERMARTPEQRAAILAARKKMWIGQIVQWGKDNPDKVLAAKRAAYRRLKAENPQKLLEKSRRSEARRSKEKRSEKWRKWKERNREYLVARSKARAALRVKATPPWADLAQIRKTYRDCRAITQATGIAYNVDHIIPLQGKIVCGLHVETNLRIVPAKINLAKKNTMPPE